MTVRIIEYEKTVNNYILGVDEEDSYITIISETVKEVKDESVKVIFTPVTDVKIYREGIQGPPGPTGPPGTGGSGWTYIQDDEPVGSLGETWFETDTSYGYVYRTDGWNLFIFEGMITELGIGGIFETFIIDNTDTEYTWEGTDGTVIADNVNDNISFVAGDNVTLDRDETNDAIRITTTGGSSNITISTTVPVSPAEGDLWWDSEDAVLNIYYNDGNSVQWVSTDATSNDDIQGAVDAAIDIHINTNNIHIPAGGTTDQVIGKISGTDYDFTWQDKSQGIPSGGTTGQHLGKLSGSDYDVSWQDRGLVSASDTAPLNPVDNDLWWDSADGVLNIYYNDGNSTQWVSTDATSYNDVHSFVDEAVSISMSLN